MIQMWRRQLIFSMLFLVCIPAVAQDSLKVEVPAEAGKLVFEQNCPGCHGWDGRGELNVAPPLIKGVFVRGDKKRLIRLMLDGLVEVEISGQYYPSPMPSFSYLTDSEIADVLTFIRKNFSNNESAITPAEVRAVRNEK